MQLTESVGWWMGDDDSHGVEISITGGVRKMVRDPAPKHFFFSFSYIMCFVFNYGEQRPSAALAMAKKKPQRPLDVSPPAPWKKPSAQVPLVWDQPHASDIK